MKRRILAGVTAVAMVAGVLLAGASPAAADHFAGSSGGTCFAGPFSGTRIPVDISTRWMVQQTTWDGRTILICAFLGLPAAVDADDPANGPGIDYVAPTEPVVHDNVLCQKGDFEYGRGTFLNMPSRTALLVCEWEAPPDWTPPPPRPWYAFLRR